MPEDDSHWPEIEILTVAQVAEWLQVNPYTVREEARRGHLPGRKVGREWRFSRAAILAWLHGNPPETLR